MVLWEPRMPEPPLTCSPRATKRLIFVILNEMSQHPFDGLLEHLAVPLRSFIFNFGSLGHQIFISPSTLIYNHIPISFSDTLCRVLFSKCYTNMFKYAGKHGQHHTC